MKIDKAQATAEAPARPKRGRPRDPERLKRVIQTASCQFLEQGFERTSMESVAQAAGVSKMTLYNYFASKNALIEACVAARTDSIFEDFGADSLSPARPEEALRLIARQFLGLMRSDDVIQLHRMLHGLATLQPDVCQGFFKAGPTRIAQHVCRYLESAMAAGTLHIEDVPLAADQLLALMLGRPHLHATLGLGKPDAGQDERLVREGVLLFLARYGKQPASSES